MRDFLTVEEIYGLPSCRRFHPLTHQIHFLSYYDYSTYYNGRNFSASIYGLQQQPAGMFVQFRTNASAVRVRYTLGHAILGMFHFPPTGVSGMDAYAWDDANAAWRWTG